MLVYIRPLILDDAKVSYAWRNDPSIWVYTNFRRPYPITPEIETSWLAGALDKQDQRRFAICIEELNTYIGNVQLLDITERSAELHLFIGDKSYWGKGLGYQATMLILKYAFFELKLEHVYLRVHPANIPAIAIYEKAGFEITKKDDGLMRMDAYKTKRRFIHSVSK
jgi:diamine N-acetyltransferase